MTGGEEGSVLEVILFENDFVYEYDADCRAEIECHCRRCLPLDALLPDAIYDLCCMMTFWLN